MSEQDFQSSFLEAMSERLPPGPDPRQIAFELFRRDQFRTRVLAALSLLFWLAGAAGMLVMVIALNRFIIFVRIADVMPFQHVGRPALTTGAAPAASSPMPVDDDAMLEGTSFIHHSLPWVGASVVSLMLAALFTVCLVFSSRKATLARIDLSLMQISEYLRQLSTGGRAGAAGSAAAPPPLPARPGSMYSHSWQGAPGAMTYTLNPGARKLIWLLAAIALVLAIGGASVFALRCRLLDRFETTTTMWLGYARISPFEAVRYRAQTPEVRVKDVWYELVSLDGIPAGQIVAACQSLDRANWQKRFEEDLVEVLARTGHPIATTAATLEVKDLETGKAQTLRDVPMTRENRQALWEARAPADRLIR